MRAFLLSFTVFLSPALVHAQGNPADFNRPGPVKEREMYYAQVRTEVNELLIRWREAWENDDPGGLARLYLEHASYYPLNTAAAQSRAAIQSHFADFLGTVGTLSINISSFGMSGDVAYVTCRVGYHRFDGAAERRVTRTDLIILRRQRNQGWLIEVQLAQEQVEEL
ncbi:MAG TPA: SgcJ/EcaC family oxidoreductase [Longimicrobiales bacterium]